MNKKYWLRGGITLAIVDLIFVLHFAAIWFHSELNSHNYVIHMIQNWLVFGFASPAFVMLFGYMGSSEPTPLNYFFIFAINVVIYFFIGAFLGWLYGKVKNKNRNKII